MKPEVLTQNKLKGKKKTPQKVFYAVLVLSVWAIPSFYQLPDFNVRKEAVQLSKYTNCS